MKTPGITTPDPKGFLDRGGYDSNGAKSNAKGCRLVSLAVSVRLRGGSRPSRSGTYPGCLREGAKSYVKRLRPERESALGQRYSPVKLMCSHPRGEMWARNSASPSFSVFQ